MKIQNTLKYQNGYFTYTTPKGENSQNSYRADFTIEYGEKVLAYTDEGDVLRVTDTSVVVRERNRHERHIHSRLYNVPILSSWTLTTILVKTPHSEFEAKFKTPNRGEFPKTKNVYKIDGWENLKIVGENSHSPIPAEYLDATSEFTITEDVEYPDYTHQIQIEKNDMYLVNLDTMQIVKDFAIGLHEDYEIFYNMFYSNFEAVYLTKTDFQNLLDTKAAREFENKVKNISDGANGVTFVRYTYTHSTYSATSYFHENLLSIGGEIWDFTEDEDIKIIETKDEYPTGMGKSRRSVSTTYELLIASDLDVEFIYDKRRHDEVSQYEKQTNTDTPSRSTLGDIFKNLKK
jgi:hypothetical protein